MMHHPKRRHVHLAQELLKDHADSINALDRYLQNSEQKPVFVELINALRLLADREEISPDPLKKGGLLLSDISRSAKGMAVDFRNRTPTNFSDLQQARDALCPDISIDRVGHVPLNLDEHCNTISDSARGLNSALSDILHAAGLRSASKGDRKIS